MDLTQYSNLGVVSYHSNMAWAGTEKEVNTTE